MSVHTDESARAERLKTARIAGGYETATEAARAHGFVASTYGAHENGSRNMTFESVAQYAEAFGVTQQWLAFGIESVSLHNDAARHQRLAGRVQGLKDALRTIEDHNHLSPGTLRKFLRHQIAALEVLLIDEEDK